MKRLHSGDCGLHPSKESITICHCNACAHYNNTPPAPQIISGTILLKCPCPFLVD